MNTKRIIEKLLKKDPRCRDDDKWLCYCVLKEICELEKDFLFIPFKLFNKFPAFETISRHRRTIQNKENRYNDFIPEIGVTYEKPEKQNI